MTSYDSDNDSTEGLSPDDSLAEEAMAWYVRLNLDAASEADQRAFRHWLACDPAHRTAYAEAEALWCELGDIRGKVGCDAHRRAAPRPSRKPIALAASVLLAVAAGLWSFGGSDRLLVDHATSVGETRVVRLADGSTVHLNTDTALTVDFTETCRCLQLQRGEAWFDVHHDADRPFRVAAGDGSARALGTAFTVRDAGEKVIVAVVEGRVHVESAMDTRGITLVSGEIAQYAPAGPVKSQRTDVARLTAWRQGRLEFEGRRLRDVVQEIDRYRPGVLLILDPGLADQRFSGSVVLDDTDRALHAIQSSLPVDVIRITRWLTLLRARD